MNSPATQIKIINVHGPGRKYGYVYVGRKFTGDKHFGNPFSHLGLSNVVVVPDRDAACDAFEKWITSESYQDVEPERRQWIINNLNKLRGKNLGCFCAPKRCHAETLMKLANA